MRILFATVSMLLLAGCSFEPEIEISNSWKVVGTPTKVVESSTKPTPPSIPKVEVDAAVNTVNDEDAALFTGSKGPFDQQLDEMSAKYYGGDSPNWADDWKIENSSVPLTGQRAVELLEIACYADLVCHPIENPLRDVTLEYVQSQLETADVRKAVEWLRKSYECRLPRINLYGQVEIDQGHTAEAMQGRLRRYANQILNGSMTEKVDK